MTAKVIYTKDLHTVAVHLRSGSAIQTDAPVDNKGKGEAFSPTDLVAVALASCMLTTMGIAGAAHEISMNEVECNVEKIMVSNPRKIGEIRVIVNFPEKAKYSDKERQILERAAITCPVLESLHPECKKTLTFNWPTE
jgi:uncharacterized OsmC-like protein